MSPELTLLVSVGVQIPIVVAFMIFVLILNRANTTESARRDTSFTQALDKRDASLALALEKIETGHTKVISDLQTSHSTTIQTIQAQHSATLQQMQMSQQSTIQQMTIQHKESMSRIAEEVKAQGTTLQGIGSLITAHDLQGISIDDGSVDRIAKALRGPL